MDKVSITVMGYSCERCGHKWIPKMPGTPRVCPSCKSAYWNVPRQRESSSKKK